MEKFEIQARELIEKKAAEKKLKPASQKASEDEISGNLDAATVGVADGDSGQTKTKGRRKGNQGGQVNKPIADAEVMSGKGGKGKRRASKGKGGGALVGETGTNLLKSSKASGKVGNASDDDDVYTLEYLAAEILKWFPDMESAGVGNIIFIHKDCCVIKFDSCRLVGFGWDYCFRSQLTSLFWVLWFCSWSLCICIAVSSLL